MTAMGWFLTADVGEFLARGAATPWRNTRSARDTGS